MPIDPDVAIGAQLPDRTFSWESSDVLLYHLGIGAGSRPGDSVDPAALRYTARQRRPPGAAQLRHRGADLPRDRPAAARPARAATSACRRWSTAARRSRSPRPLPTFGSAVLRTRITDVWDKGKAAVIWQEGQALTAEGDALWTVRSSIFVRGEGGWGGDRGTSAKVEVPDRAPDCDASYDVTPQQALLYRLCGDRNPLHADPEFAKAAGFPAPILHGLCSYGIVLRTVTDELFGGDAAQGPRLQRPLRRRGVPRRDHPGARLARRRGRRRRGDDRRRGRARRGSRAVGLRAHPRLTPLSRRGSPRRPARAGPPRRRPGRPRGSRR